MSDLVEVEVLEVGSTGVQVRILDGELANRVGFIRRAELSWDQRPGVEPPWLRGDHTVTAQVLGSRDARYVRLSLRLGDPWAEQGVEERFHEGQVVQGHVVQLSRYGAFVQLLPGVDALARHAAIPLSPDQRLDEVLSVGDEVQAIITKIDPEQRQIEISLIERLRQLSLLRSEERRSFQVDLFQDVALVEEHPPTLAVEEPQYEVQEEQAVEPSGNLLTAVRHFFQKGKQAAGTEPREAGRRSFAATLPSLAKLERVLIVENDKADQRELARRITATFEVAVDVVVSAQEVLEKVATGLEYDLVLMDVNLGDGNAVEIAERLRQAQALLVIVYMSRAPLADENLPGGSLFVLKSRALKSILQLITQMRQKEDQEAPETAGETLASTRDFVRHLGMEAFARRSREELLQPMLHRLRLQSRVSQVIVLKVDSVNKEVSVVAADPQLEENTQEYLLDRLYYSPMQTSSRTRNLITKPIR